MRSIRAAGIFGLLFVSRLAAAPPAPVWVTTPAGVNIRSGAGTGYAVQDVAPHLSFLGLRGNAASGFLPVSYHTVSGWASSAYLTTGRLAAGSYARVLNASATIRTSASASAPILAAPGMNAAVFLLSGLTSDPNTSWWKVQWRTYTGWMASYNLAPCSTTGASKQFAYPGRGNAYPLQDFSPSMVSYIQARSASIGVSIYDNASGNTYAWNGDWKVRTASIVKVPVMMTVMDRAVRENRALTSWEKSHVEPMIRWSSNSDTTALWNDLGGAPAMGAYLRSIGVTNTVPDPTNPGAWGYTLTTANDFVKILGKLYFRQTLRDDLINYGLYQMTQLIPEHRDGVFYSAGGTKNWYAVKGGYYPETDSGYTRMHSVGIVDLVDDAYDPAKGLDGTRTYIVSVMTRYPNTYGEEYGIQVTGDIAKIAYQAVLARK